MAEKRTFRRQGKCKKCREIVEARCENCGCKRIVRRVDHGINDEWFDCRSCRWTTHWVLCKECLTQNPLSIFDESLAMRGCGCVISALVLYVLYKILIS